MRRPPPSFWCACLALVAAGVYVALTLRISTGITQFMPAGEDKRLAPLSRELAESTLTQTLVVDVGADDLDTAVAVASDLSAQLEKHPGVAEVITGPPTETRAAWYEVFYPRRFAFVGDDDDALEEALSATGVDARVEAMRRRLSGPMGAMTRRLAPGDPLMAFEHHVERMRALAADTLELHEGVFVVREDLSRPDPSGRRHAILFVRTRGSAFSAEEQAPLLGFLEVSFGRLQAAHDGDITLEQSGVHPFAVDAESSIRADITRISIVSTIGLILLFIGVFRRVRYLLLAFVPLGAGVLLATAASIALFGSVHGLTLAFGASLIGVAIDYPVHLFNHHDLARPPEGEDVESDTRLLSLQRVWPGLLLGALTTVAGFAGLAATDYPGIREVAVFASVGVLAALLSTRWVITPLLPSREVPPSRLQRVLAQGLLRAVDWMRGRRRVLLILPVAALIVTAVGLPTVRWVDDVAALNALDPELRAEDTRVRERTMRADAGRFLVALGDDIDGALVSNQRAHAVARAAEAEGLIDEVRSVHAMIWPERAQRASLEAVYRNPDLADRVRASLEANDFEPAAFSPFFEEIAGDPPSPVGWDTLTEKPAIAQSARPFRVDLDDGRVALLTFVHGVRDPDAIADRADAVDGVVYFDQSAFLERTSQAIRERALELIGIGFVAILALLLLRYRRPRVTLAAFAPALLAAAATLSLWGLAREPVTILHVVSLLLVTSIGVDYGVFLAESREHGRAGLSATMSSLVMACASTVLAFGLLGMSDMPSLEAIGMTVGPGVALSLLLAPTALVLAGEADVGDST